MSIAPKKIPMILLWTLIGVCGFIYIGIEAGWGVAVAFWATIFSQTMIRNLKEK